MIDKGKKSVLGVLIDAVDYEAAVGRVFEAARARRSLGVSALATHGVLCGATDRVHKYRLNHLDLVVPDGQPVRWALNLLYGVSLSDRVYGPDLTRMIFRRAGEEGLSIALYGSRKPVLDLMVARIKESFPGISVSFARPSLFRRMSGPERQEVVESIRKSGASMTFVGLGCPRQEVWAYEFKDDLAMPVIAVGAAFDFMAGTLPQAPAVLQRAGLEWLYRLRQEPGRLWRRYLLGNPAYAALLLLQWTGLRTFDPSDAVSPSEPVYYG